MVWNPGKQLFGGRYIIEQYLGKGGIGITYLAKNKQGQLRVIKTLREEILNSPAWIPHQSKLKQDFKEEALRLALCRHPHIVEVENVFDDADLPCMAMEYIEGEDLGKRITLKGALPEAEALQYIGQIGDALILVHEKGLLHRDLKPSNIMMRAGKPEAVLIDFGLARQFIPGAVQRHTESRTDGYAPPEQYIPDAERGEYIDVYALAATLYSLLTGQLPMPVPVRLQNFTLQPPKELNSSVGDKVNEAIMRGMALNYKFRPQSVQEWLDLLGAGIVRPTQPAIPSWECAQIIPGISSKIALSPKGDILACVAGSLIHLYSSTTGELLRTLTGHSGIVRSIAISSDGQLLASYSEEDSIRLWDVATGRTIRTFTGRSGMSSLAISNDGQFLASGDWYAIRLWDVATGRTIRTFTRPHPSNIPGAYLTIAISSDGQLLASCSQASGSGDKTIKLWDVATGRKIRTFTGHSDTVSSIAISSDGQLLASCSEDKTIRLWELSKHWLQKIKVRKIRTLTGHSDIVYSVAISSDGQLLASCSKDKTIRLWDVVTGREIRTFTGHSDTVSSIAISSDGQLLAGVSWDGIRLWDVATGREIRTFTGHSGTVRSIAISSDGQLLASGSDGDSIRLWDVATGRKIRTFTGHSDRVYPAAISSDGQLLASGSDHKTIRLWDVATGRKIRTFTGHSDRVYPAAISSDGQLLASCIDDRTIKLWDVATGREIRTLTGHFNRLYSVAISSNGQLLASCMDDKTIKLWDVATGREIRTFTGHSGIVQSIAISRDGQLLASIGGGYKCDNTIKLWDVQTGKEICTLSHFYGVRSVAFIRDDNWLATGTLLGNIIIWRRS